jgi:hypothetical protein
MMDVLEQANAKDCIVAPLDTMLPNSGLAEREIAQRQPGEARDTLAENSEARYTLSLRVIMGLEI